MTLQGSSTEWVCTMEEPGGESWTRSSTDFESTISLTIEAMIPSRLARHSLLELLISGSKGTSAPVPVADTQATERFGGGFPDPVAPVSLPAEIDEQVSPQLGQEPAKPELSSPSSADAAGEGAETLDGSNVDVTVSADPVTLAPSMKESLAPESRTEKVPLLGSEEAEEVLEGQIREISAALSDLDGLAPHAIQLILLHWISRMRAVEESTKGSEETADLCHRIAGLLSQQARLHWPGNILALRLDARPGDCRCTLRGLAGDFPLATWKDVSAAAEDALAELEESADLDQAGWADGIALSPAPNLPDELLVELSNQLENLSQRWNNNLRTPTRADLQVRRLRDTLLDIGRKTRWLRGTVEDVASWARLMGRLRCISSQRHAEFPELKAILDSEFTPPAGSWAKELGTDPRKKQQQREKRELFDRVPEPDADPASLQGWFVDSCELEVPTDQQLFCLEQHSEQILAWDGEALLAGGELRKARRKLKKLQESMRDRDGVLDRSRIKAELEQLRTTTEEEREERPSDSHASLRERVRLATEGRRILFVTNREDPALKENLREQLAADSVAFVVADNRRIDAASSAIANAKYDLVLCVTGFVGHSSEKSIRSACERAGSIPCVRAYKGRVLSVLRSIDRDLGLDEDPARS